MKPVSRFSSTRLVATAASFIGLAVGMPAATTQVHSLVEAAQIVPKASPGDEIVLDDGTYAVGTFSLKGKGQEGAPIVVRAQTVGGVRFDGTTKITLDGEYIELRGVCITGDGSMLKFERTARHCALVDVAMDKCGNNTWLEVWGQYCRISYCSFTNKQIPAGEVSRETLRIREEPAVDTAKGKPSSGFQHHATIDHCYFYNFSFAPDEKETNGSEAIQVGMYMAYELEKKGNAEKFVRRLLWVNDRSESVIEYNYINKWCGEIEIISVKSSGNILRHNTIRASNGAMTLRQADDCEVSANYFLQGGNKEGGGLRVFGSNHKIYNNYFDQTASGSTRSALVLHCGWNDGKFDPQRPQHVTVAFNTFVNCGNSIIVSDGTTGRPLPPDSCVVTHNLLYCDQGKKGLINLFSSATAMKFEENIAYSEGVKFEDAVSADARSGVQWVDPKVERASDGIYYPTPSSPVVDAAKTPTAVDGFVIMDVAGQTRSVKKDIGALEMTPGTVREKPFTDADVGIRVGQRKAKQAVAGAL